MMFTDNDLIDVLREIPLFSELHPEQLEEIAYISSTVDAQKHAVLFHEGDRYNGFYILLQGIVKVYKTNEKGRESVVHIIKPKMAFADIPLFEGNDYPVSAQCLDNASLLFIPKDKFIQQIKKDTELSLRMLAGFAKRMKGLVEKLESLSQQEVINRFCAYVYNELQRSGMLSLPEPFLKLTVPKSTIAAYIGTITETLSRTMKKMQSDGIIRIHGKKVFVTDLNRLKSLIQ